VPGPTTRWPSGLREDDVDSSAPLVADVSVVVRSASEPQTPEVRLRDWLLNPNGQAVIREAGYVPLLVL